MGTKEWLGREKYVALHAQSARFRIIKYIIIVTAFIGFSFWRGWKTALMLLLCLAIMGVIVHFILRWKTKAWTQSWGPYKKINLPK